MAEAAARPSQWTPLELGIRNVLGARKRRQVAQEIASAARAKYGELKRRKIRPPLDQLVQSILWRHTSVRRGTRALRELKRTFVDWNEVRVSPIVEIARAVSSADWSCSCAEHLRSALWGLFTASNVVSLELIHELPTSQARAFLQGLPGVPRDVADEVLLFSCGAPLLPVGDSAARMCHRLGLIESDPHLLRAGVEYDVDRSRLPEGEVLLDEVRMCFPGA